jgi:PAS domain S-box-containing protein
MVSDLSTQAQMLADNCAGSLSFDDPIDARQVLNSLRAKAPIAFACIYRSDGSVFAAYQRDGSSLISAPPEPHADSYSFERGWLTMFRRVNLNNRPIGTIYLQSDLSELSSFIKQSAIALVLMIVLSSVIAYALSSKLQKLISSPILHLTDTFATVSQTRNYSVRAIRQSKDEVGQLTESFNDMLAQVETGNSALQESEEKVRLLLSSTAEAIYGLDTNGNCTFCNPSCIKILGYENESDLLGKNIHNLIHHTRKDGTVYPIDECKIYETFKKGQGTHIDDEVFWCADGTCFPAEYWSYPIHRKGEVIGSVVTFLDITDRKRAEEELQQEKEFSNKIIETADAIIVGLDLKGKIILFNKKAEEITGYIRTEVMGKDFMKNLLPHYKGTDFHRMFNETITGRVAGPRDISITTREGEKRIINSRGTPLKDKDEMVIGILGIGTDVTELRNMQQKTLQSEKLKSLGELAGGVAHDFNNVLAAILGNAQLLQMSLTPPEEGEEKRKTFHEMKHGLTIIEKAAKDGAETVRRIQSFSRKRADDTDFLPVDINELLNHALEFTRVKWKGEAEKKGIHIAVHKEYSSVPPTLGSASELREVFTNIVNNAVDAMHQGGTITIRTFKENGSVSITIGDTGTGIPESLRGRIFDPFFTTKGVQSTGLGMSVSYGIINRHRGTITIDSAEGKGTTFIIHLPIAEIALEEEKGKQIQVEQRKARILVIEDEEQVRNLLSAILTKGGHQVEIATDGSQGIEIFREKEFDLVFTDLGMPGISGWQVAEKIKSINGNVPVTLITGWNVELEQSELKEKGVDLVIQKPFDIEQVLTLVQEGIKAGDRLKSA